MRKKYGNISRHALEREKKKRERGSVNDYHYVSKIMEIKKIKKRKRGLKRDMEYERRGEKGEKD